MGHCYFVYKSSKISSLNRTKIIPKSKKDNAIAIKTIIPRDEKRGIDSVLAILFTSSLISDSLCSSEGMLGESAKRSTIRDWYSARPLPKTFPNTRNEPKNSNEANIAEMAITLCLDNYKIH
jgi:hypothetical protein